MIVTLAIAAASTAAALIGNRKAKKAAKRQAAFEAEQLRIQAEYNRHRARIAIQNGNLAARRRAEQLARDIGSNRAGAAGHGLLLDNRGTVATLRNSLRHYAAIDQHIISRNTAMEVFALRMNAANQEASAANAIANAKAMARASDINTASRIINSLGDAYAKGAFDFGGNAKSAGEAAGGTTALDWTPDPDLGDGGEFVPFDGNPFDGRAFDDEWLHTVMGQ